MRPSAHVVDRVGIEVELGGPSGEPVADPRGRPLDGVAIDVVEDDLPAGLEGDLADAGAHHAGADDPDDRHTDFSASNGWRHAAAVEQRPALGRAERAVHDDVGAVAERAAHPAGVIRRCDPGLSEGGPAGVEMRSDVHGTSNVVSTRTGRSNRSDRVSAIDVRITSRAGQPTNVGRIATSIASGPTSTRCTMPRSTTDRTGSLRIGHGREHRADIAAPMARRRSPRRRRIAAPHSRELAPQPAERLAVIGPTTTTDRSSQGRAGSPSRSNTGATRCSPVALEVGHRAGEDAQPRRASTFARSSGVNTVPASGPRVSSAATAAAHAARRARRPAARATI